MHALEKKIVLLPLNQLLNYPCINKAESNLDRSKDNRSQSWCKNQNYILMEFQLIDEGINCCMIPKKGHVAHIFTVNILLVDNNKLIEATIIRAEKNPTCHCLTTFDINVGLISRYIGKP